MHSLLRIYWFFCKYRGSYTDIYALLPVDYKSHRAAAAAAAAVAAVAAAAVASAVAAIVKAAAVFVAPVAVFAAYCSEFSPDGHVVS